MNIHEYQAKALFNQFLIPTPKGLCMHETLPMHLDSLASFGDTESIVVKAQIHAGGRGKGCFVENGGKGIQMARTKAEALTVAQSMLGNTLVTKQTGPQGKKVRTVYLAEAIEIDREFYLALLIDRERFQPLLVASAEGGTEIEELALRSPEKILKVTLDPLLGVMPYQIRKVGFLFGLKGEAMKQLEVLLRNLYRLFLECDASLVEINPLVLTKSGQLQALDAKVQFDANALYRHPTIVALRDTHEEDPKEVLASQFGLNYIALQGNIACLVNGAGLAMATMDIIRHYGGSPANFLDVGGGANADQVREAFKIILSDSNVKGILINVFGGILRCDVIAQGILEAVRSVRLSIPLVVRLQGTNVEAARELLKQSGLPLISVEGLAEAAKTIVECVKESL